MTLRISILLTLLISSIFSFAQQKDKIVEVTGVTLSADSQQALPDIAVIVRHKERGVLTNYMGVFSLVCEQGDTLSFRMLGYKNVDYVIPTNLQSKYLHIVQVMTQDTFYLPETIISNALSKEDLLYAIKHLPPPESQYQILQRNMSPESINMMMQTMPRTGIENQAAYQAQQAYKATYYGQVQPMGIFNIFKWAEFFQAWKRGDFKSNK